MRELAAGVLIDAARAQIARVREKTLTTKWFRDNANARRALPEQQPSTDDAELGLLYAIQVGEAASDAAVSGNADAGSGGGGASKNAPTIAAPTASEPSQAAGSGINGQTTINVGGAGIVPSGSGVVAGSGSNGDSRRSRNWAIPWIVATGASILGAGGVGFGISNSLNRVTNPPDTNLTVVEGDNIDAEYPLLDYIEEQGWHRK